MKRSSLLLTCIIGLALTGAALILLVPPMFNPEGTNNAWLIGGLALLALVFAAGALRWKPSSPVTDSDR